VISACDNAESGIVNAKEFIAAHNEYVGNQCFGFDSNGNCTVNIPMFEWRNDEWVVYFYNEQDDENGSVSVTKEEYEFYKHGDHFPRLR